ncbi:STAS domain-containing protein [Mycobacterium sp.]|jgi:anti-anti-sigma factor|uniref:STAS domain-containing protein n=1 Tax=Mycobacterium sp. TaxID=1785 RepID=UPI002D2363D5|nr:STAS domain-containing protein [Mycobacterium sp.]HZA10314.1 STAS domain-containing protein [Mycobacterium sp.]
MTDLLTCTVISNHECAIAYLDTELEISSVDWLADRLSPLAAEGRDVVLNLAALRFLGTAGLHALVDLGQQATATGGSVRLAEPPAAVWRLLNVVGMQNFFGIARSRADL